MTTSGLDAWVPTIGELADDALEYANIDPASASQRHLASLIRSYNQVSVWLGNSNEAIFRDDIETIVIKKGQPFFFLPDGTLSVRKAMLRKVGEPTSYSNNIETIMKAVWFDMPAKSQVGRPSVLALNYAAPVSPDGLFTDTEKTLDTPPTQGGYGEQGYGDLGYAAQKMYGEAYDPGQGIQGILWPVPDEDYILDYMRVRQTQKATQLGQNPDANLIWIEAITHRLAYYMCLKYNRKDAANHERLSNEALARTNMNNRETADVFVSVQTYSPARSPRRYR